jgi:DNA-binding NtrC family response regulator
LITTVSLPVTYADSVSAIIASADPALRERVVNRLQAANWSAEEAGGGAEALAKLDTKNYAVLLVDRWLPDLNVAEVVELARLQHPDMAVYTLDGATDLPIANGRSGQKSVPRIITDILEDLRGRPEMNAVAEIDPIPIEVLPDEGPIEPQLREEPLPDMIGTSLEMQQVYRMVRMVAPRTTTVIILGGTGTGKELVARAIHCLGPRSRQSFVTVNCAAIPEALLESELFGYTRGAFTGAFQTRIGRLQAAHGGTLFLDEVGDLPASMQAKLLRFLQEGEVQRLGSSDVLHVDVRVIAATNVDLAERVRQKAFREDLYYRLSVFPIYIQPLQQRIEDILPLSQHFLTGFCRESGTSTKRISLSGRAVLERHSWPGNVRELRHVMERAFILSGNGPEILREHIHLQAF